MPELPEIKIMSDYINYHSKDRVFKKFYHVERGNIPIDLNLIENFKITSDSNGKELLLKMKSDNKQLNFSVFMGMSGNWMFVPTEIWHTRKFTRMRLDTVDGNSLLLYGIYMGPKYKLGGFTGVKRGPDPVKQFDVFKKNIIDNLDKSVFDKSICQVLLDQRYFNGIGAYLTAEIVGRLDINPFISFKKLNSDEIDGLLNMVLKCCNESYSFGGGELQDWRNPFGKNNIRDWIKFYLNKELCYKQKFGNRNIWIQKKFKSYEII